MAFKESVAYSKDLVNGTEIEVLKKKLIMPFTGTAIVKLYDSLTGKQTYEAKSENRISAVFGNMAYLDGFYYPMLDNTQDNILNDIYTTYPFTRITGTKHYVMDFPTNAANGTFRGVKKANFHVLRETKAPAVLIEIGFVDNTGDNNLFDAKRNEIIKGISKAILSQSLSVDSQGTLQKDSSIT